MKLHVAALAALVASIVLLALVVSAPPSAPQEWAGKPALPARGALSDDGWLEIFGKHLCAQNQTRYVKNNTTFVEECDWMDDIMPSGRGALGLVKRTWRINETGWASLYSGAWPKGGVTEKRWQ